MIDKILMRVSVPIRHVLGAELPHQMVGLISDHRAGFRGGMKRFTPDVSAP